MKYSFIVIGIFWVLNTFTIHTWAQQEDLWQSPELKALESQQFTITPQLFNDDYIANTYSGERNAVLSEIFDYLLNTPIPAPNSIVFVYPAIRGIMAYHSRVKIENFDMESSTKTMASFCKLHASGNPWRMLLCASLNTEVLFSQIYALGLEIEEELADCKSLARYFTKVVKALDIPGLTIATSGFVPKNFDNEGHAFPVISIRSKGKHYLAYVLDPYFTPLNLVPATEYTKNYHDKYGFDKLPSIDKKSVSLRFGR